ncbi:MAG TPA: family 43 glycosylhydrolase [Polyangiaceae bacterium]|nr:family 43 glycosylhydrolase [Polyangiaceae bacterium]
MKSVALPLSARAVGLVLGGVLACSSPSHDSPPGAGANDPAAHAGSGAGGAPSGVAGTGGAPAAAAGSSASAATGGVLGSAGAPAPSGKAGGSGDAGGSGGASSAGSGAGSGAAGASTGTSSAGVSVITGTLEGGVAFHDDKGALVNAHGGGVNQVGDTFYLSGEYFVYSASASYDTNNSFHGVSMYSSKDLVTWKFEKLILPQQASGELGPNRIGERPHIIKCPSTGEFVLYAHAASIDYQTDKEVVYATSATINGDYKYQGPLTNKDGVKAVHSDMSALVDADNHPYVITESGHVYKLADDCHSWTSDTAYSAMNGMESPTAFKAGDSYFWIMSNKTGWRANDNEYASAPSMTGPWTKRGLIAPADAHTWISQSTFVLPVVGSEGTVYVYFGDHWQNADDQTGKTTGKNNSLATLVVQPLVIEGNTASLPKFYASWKLDIGKGTWSP